MILREQKVARSEHSIRRDTSRSGKYSDRRPESHSRQTDTIGTCGQTSRGVHRPEEIFLACSSSRLRRELSPAVRPMNQKQPGSTIRLSRQSSRVIRHARTITKVPNEM